jgi:signal transduction histidine kinase/CheY-like chemotaxis protein
MMISPVTIDEQKRIKALYDYDILDTEAEKAFDDLTLLASEICETPIALISLVDPTRQWFKSTVGLDAFETERDIAFCAHAIHEHNIFEIPNALEDERFADNPLVTGAPNIRFYAGAPLVTPDGFAIGTLCAISDKPKKLNSHQLKSLEILSREVITQMELRKKVSELKKANDFTNDFLSNMSHEIRTPLNAIHGFSELLSERCHKLKLPSDIQDYISEIDFSAKHLLSIVNSVLDLSKIESGKMELVPSWFQGHLFLKNTKSMMDVQATDKGIKLLLEIDSNVPDYFYFDEGKLSQILINLISNSIKFTLKDKKIIFKISYINDDLIFNLMDEGVGITDENQNKLFNKYQQVGDNKNIEGTGLGLSITKSLVELMVGKITLTSKKNVGTTVLVTLPQPANQPNVNDIENTVKPLQIIQQLNILVVEDNAINRKLAKIILEHMGQIVTFAESGELALVVTKTQQFDLILMDIHMPGINGVETSHKIRENNILTPIVALTADIFEIQKNDENSFIFDDYLTKPINKKQLEHCLRKQY